MFEYKGRDACDEYKHVSNEKAIPQHRRFFKKNQCPLTIGSQSISSSSITYHAVWIALVSQLVYTTSNSNPWRLSNRPAFFASSTPSSASGGSSQPDEKKSTIFCLKIETRARYSYLYAKVPFHQNIFDILYVPVNKPRLL